MKMDCYNKYKPYFTNIKWILVTLFCIVSSALESQNNLAQQLKITHYQVKDGLSQGSVYSMLRDSRGFMWFCSYEGLNRLDGHDFRVYRDQANDSTSLKGSTTLGIVEDGLGNIWVGSEICLNRYLRSTDQFDYVMSSDTQQSTHYPFYADSTEVWYINERDGIIRYNFLTQEKHIISSSFFYTRSTIRFNTVFRVSDGTIWIRLEKGLAQLNPETGAVRYYLSDHEDNVFGTVESSTCFYEEAADQFLIATETEIIRINITTQSQEVIELPISDAILSIQKDALGNFWFGSDNSGLYYYNPQSKQLDKLHSAINSPIQIGANSVGKIYLDQQNLLWLSVDPSGVDVLFRNDKPFEQYAHNFFDPLQFNDSGVRCFAENERGQIWIGTEHDGLVLMDTSSRTIIKRIFPNINTLLNDSEVSCLLSDSHQRLWLGSYIGLYYLNEEENRFINITNNAKPGQPISSNSIWSIVESKKGDIVFSTDSGIFYIQAGTETIAAIDTFSEMDSGFLHYADEDKLLVPEHNNGFYVISDRDWISQTSGIAKTQRVIHHHLKGLNVKHFYYDEQRSVWWICTSTGLVKARMKNNWEEFEILKFYTAQDGLTSVYLYGLLPDENGKFWISSNHGLIYFDPSTERFFNYTPNDGIQGYEFNTNAFLKSSSGHFYFGGTQGFNRLKTNIKSNNVLPNSQLTAMLINGEAAELENYIGETDQIQLNYDQNTFSFQFTAVDFISNGSNTYKVWLEGYEKDWHYLADQNNVRYTKVPAGNYTFHLLSANNDGLWEKESTQVKINISSAWWNTWLAKSCYAFILFFIGKQIYNVRKKREQLNWQLLLEQKEAKRLKELDATKSTLLTNITHEFRTPLTVIKGMAGEIKDNDKAKNLIQKNANNLLSLVNQMLDLSKLESGSMPLNLRQSNIIRFLNYQTEAFQSFALTKNISIAFYSELENLEMDFDEEKIQQVISNLIANALKFTPQYGKIMLIGKHDVELQQFQIIISDSGLGIPKENLDFIFDRFYQVNNSSTRSKDGTGIGLALTKILVELHGGNITVESKLGKGTSFTIHLPITNFAKKEEILIPIKRKSIIAKEKAGELLIPTNIENLQLLIIEDNYDVIQYLETILKSKYQTLIARDGKEGIEKALLEIPDIIICDVMMPEKDGFEVCQYLKQNELTDHIPIILLTAKATSKDKIAGLRHGADAYLMKPFQKEELLVRLEKLLVLRKRLQKKYSNTLTKEKIDKPIDNQFLQKVNNIVLANLDKEDFSVHQLGRELAMSRSQVHRKLKALTGMSTAIYIRSIRLNQAKTLLQKGALSVTEIAYAVGFSSLSYFSKNYKDTFGETPNATRK